MLLMYRFLTSTTFLCMEHLSMYVWWKGKNTSERHRLPMQRQKNRLMWLCAPEEFILPKIFLKSPLYSMSSDRYTGSPSAGMTRRRSALSWLRHHHRIVNPVHPSSCRLHLPIIGERADRSAATRSPQDSQNMTPCPRLLPKPVFGPLERLRTWWVIKFDIMAGNGAVWTTLDITIPLCTILSHLLLISTAFSAVICHDDTSALFT